MHSLFILALPLLVLVWRPRQSVLLMQFVLVADGIMVALLLPFRSADALTVATGITLLTALYPDVRALMSMPALGNRSHPLLGLTLLCCPFLVYEAARLVLWQVQGVGGDHATAGHWVASATIPIAVIVASLLAVTRQPGWRTLAISVGLSLLYLGAAAIALPTYDGSWGTVTGLASLIAGSAYLLLTGYEAYASKARPRSTDGAVMPVRGELAITAIVGLACIVLAVLVIRGTAAPRPAGAGDNPDVVAGLPAITSPGFSFNQTEIKARAGTAVALRFHNTHDSPHSFDIDDFHVHVPAAPGEQRLVDFTPTIPGTYTFYCAIPGHRELGMEGKLIVETGR